MLDFSRRDVPPTNVSFGRKSPPRRSPSNDGVSKNITQVLENLLKNYESSQLPSHGKGNKLFSIKIKDIDAVGRQT